MAVAKLADCIAAQLMDVALSWAGSVRYQMAQFWLALGPQFISVLPVPLIGAWVDSDSLGTLKIHSNSESSVRSATLSMPWPGKKVMSGFLPALVSRSRMSMFSQHLGVADGIFADSMLGFVA